MRRRTSLVGFACLILAATVTAGVSIVAPADAQPANVTGRTAAAPTQSAPEHGTKGSRGIGDPYFPLDGNGGYDVRHYGIDDSYQLTSGALRGTTTVSAVATQNLSQFDLDLVLTADSVTVDGAAAQFHSGAHELVVTPPHVLASGKPFTVAVAYHGNPNDIAFGGERPWNATDGEVMATNEPHIAPWWFAGNDHPTDKATYDITVTVPAGDQVVSNGNLVSHHTNGDTSSWHWSMQNPISSYLAFFAAGRFTLKSGVARGLPYTLAVSRLLSAPEQQTAMTLLAKTPAIVQWLQSEFGSYPFGSTGGVITSLDTGFSLENATRPTYPYLGGGPGAVSTVVHELAHQWFGDDVSVERWRDIWLNEGFASFTQWLYTETHGGKDAQRKLVRVYDLYPSSAAFWKVPIGNPGAARIFDDAVYQRGAMTLQGLRHRMGDAPFDRLLRQWVVAHAGGNGTIAEFETLATRVSGQDLTGFFHDWLFSTKKPARTKENGF
jgi:aminopeptidase N